MPTPPHCRRWLGWAARLGLYHLLARPPTPQTVGPPRAGDPGPSTQWGFKKTGNLTKSLREGLWSQSTLETESTIPCVASGSFLGLSVPASSLQKGKGIPTSWVLAGINETMHVWFNKCSNGMNYRDATQCFLFQEAFPDFYREKSVAFLPTPHGAQSPLGSPLCILVSVCMSVP